MPRVISCTVTGYARTRRKNGARAREIGLFCCSSTYRRLTDDQTTFPSPGAPRRSSSLALSPLRSAEGQAQTDARMVVYCVDPKDRRQSSILREVARFELRLDEGELLLNAMSLSDKARVRGCCELLQAASGKLQATRYQLPAANRTRRACSAASSAWSRRCGESMQTCAR